MNNNWPNLKSLELHETLDAIGSNFQTYKDRRHTDVSVEIDFINTMGKLYEQSKNDNYYWQYCSLEVYKKVIDERFQQYVYENPIGTFEDFSWDELSKISGSEKEVDTNYLGFNSRRGKSLFYFIIRQGFTYSEIKLESLIDEDIYEIFKNSVRQKSQYIIEEDIRRRNHSSEINNSRKEKKQNTIYKTGIANDPKDESEDNQSGFGHLFVIDGFNIFCYLDRMYTRDDRYQKAKFSNLYNFLDEKKLLLCSKQEYIDFIKAYKSVELSKILEKNFKFENRIRPHLNDQMLSYKRG